MPPQPLIPSSFLPHLPRSQNSFEPLSITDLLAHIGVLRSLYIPPVHGGFEVSDCLLEDEDAVGGEHKISKDGSVRHGEDLNGPMAGLGLNTGSIPLDIPSSSSSRNGNEPNGHNDTLEESGEDDEEEESREHLDPFERDWSEKWLNGVVRRAQGWLEENESDNHDEEGQVTWREMEGVLKDASAALAMMAGTSATGSLTRHLVFPLDPSLEPGLRATRSKTLQNPSLSPAAHTFLQSLATSPTSPLTLRQHLSTSPQSPTTTITESESPSKKRKRAPAVPILLHDAPMANHLSVGVQTWGSAILLGRRMAKYPDQFGLFDSFGVGGIRILELGAGTGLLSILCRKLLDLKIATDSISSPNPSKTSGNGLIVATDFLSEVIDNLETCVNLNFPSSTETGIEIAKLDWTTFPTYMASRSHPTHPDGRNGDHEGQGEETSRFMDNPFDLILASDCVYDETHAKMLRDVVSWTLRLPEDGDQGGTFHILSPIRPTFTPELESIDTHFPPHPTSSTRPPTDRNAERVGRQQGEGEGLGKDRGLVIGTRGGKRSMIGRRGEGRIDENKGYWWWEVGWA